MMTVMVSVARIGAHQPPLVLTSAAWTVMHIQYDVFLLTHILLIGLLLGWLRWASGSTVLTIGLHALANLVATVQAAIKVEWAG